MLIVDTYTTTTYNQPLHERQGPTEYLVPEQISRHSFNDTKMDWEHIDTAVGRTPCGKLIHQVRKKFKNYLKSLDANKDPLYEKEMSKHRNKEGFFNPKYENYNAKRMVEDEKFIPPFMNVWHSGRWPRDTFTAGCKTPQWHEPYWHTTHSIQKSNDWILEHLDDMNERVKDGYMTQAEYRVIYDHLDDCIIEMPDQSTKQTITNLFEE